MGKIKKVSMRAQCYEIIKEKILRQEYDLGEGINIVNLSAELSCSNTPIREALSQLEADGLVKSSLNNKAHVISFTEASFKHIAQSTYVIVKGAYELCVAENKIPVLVEMLNKSLTCQERLLADDDYHLFLKEIVLFDQIMFDALGNPHLQFLFHRLSNVLFLMYRTHHQRSDWNPTTSFTEHQKITNAIEAGNHKEVDRVFLEHYSHSYIEN